MFRGGILVATVMVPNISDIDVVGTALRESKPVTETKKDQRGKSVDLQLDIWRDKSIQTDSILSSWTEEPVKLLGVWLGP